MNTLRNLKLNINLVLLPCVLVIALLTPLIAHAYSVQLASKTTLSTTLAGKSVANRGTTVWNSYPGSGRGNYFSKNDSFRGGLSSSS